MLIACVAAWPLLSNSGFLNTRGGGDSPFLLQRLHQLTTALADGHFPVRWMPDANYGYGYPFYNFYAPLSIYIAAAFRLIGFSTLISLKLTQLVGFLVAAWGVFTLVSRWWGSNWAALIASAAYTLAPFHMVNVYVRGDSLAEFWAMAFYPLILLAVDQLCDQIDRDQRPVKGVMALALAYASLVLSHNISALIFTPFLGLYVFMRMAQHKRKAAVFSWALSAGLLALGLSAWFWLPAISEQELAQLGPVTEGYFSYGQHFRSDDLIQRALFFDYGVTTDDAGPFRMGLMQTAIGAFSVFAALWAFWRKESRWLVGFALIAVGLATYMMTPASVWLWDGVPLLEFTQFPWRFLSVQALALACLAGCIAFLPHKLQGWISLPLIGILLMGALGSLTPDFIVLAEDDISAESLAEYEWFTGNIGTTISAEYLPSTMQPRPFTSGWLNTGERNEAVFVAGKGNADIQQRQSTTQQWRVLVLTEAATLILPTAFWPGWTAESNGEPILLRAAPSGLMQLELGLGEHEITLKLRRNLVRLSAEIFSLITLAGLVWFGRAYLNRLVLPLVVGCFIVFMIGVPLRVFEPEPEPPSLRTWDFAQRGYLHREPDGILFADGSRLIDIEIPTKVVRAGDSTTIQFEWAGEEPAIEVDLVTPAIHRAQNSRPAPVMVQAEQIGKREYVLDVPPDLATGLYVPRVRGAVALTDNFEERGSLFLSPIRVVNEGDAGQADTSAIQLKATAVTTLENGNLLVDLAYLTPYALSANYHLTVQLDDARTLFYAKHDRQPGYGFLPSSDWPVGVPVFDQVELALVADDYEPPFTLSASLYDVVTGQKVAVRQLGTLSDVGGEFDPTEVVYELPDSAEIQSATFGELITLEGFEIEQTADELNLVLYWQGQAVVDKDYRHFVHLIGADGALACDSCQHDSMPRLGAYPTSQWTLGEVVSDPARIRLDGLAAGEYRLLVGLYSIEGDSYPRVPITDAAGEVSDNALPLTFSLRIDH